MISEESDKIVYFLNRYQEGVTTRHELHWKLAELVIAHPDLEKQIPEEHREGVAERCNGIRSGKKIVSFSIFA
jgi:hypothetical protein